MQKDRSQSRSRLGDKEAGPRRGPLDIINLRLNGYTFHTELCTGKQSDRPRVRHVLQQWAEIVPYYSRASPARPGRQAADQVVNKKAA